MNCGDIWSGNVTQDGSDAYDYFAVINATDFTLLGTKWEVTPSSSSCDAGIYLMFAPNSESNCSFGPKEKYISDGDTFSFKVSADYGPDCPVDTWDFIFFDSTGSFPCSYTVKMTQTELSC